MARIAPGSIVLPVPPDVYEQNYMYELVRQVENAISELRDAKYIQGGWTVTNFTTARTVDMASASDAGNSVATLVSDMIAKGLLDGVD